MTTNDYAPRPVKRQLAVYTAIVGGYDQELGNGLNNKSWDFILFADQKVKAHSSFVYRGIPAQALDADPVRVARYIKTHPHTLLSDYEATLWIDGNVVLKPGKLEALISDYLQRGVEAAFRLHPERSSISEELLACHERNKDSFAAMYKQVTGYGENRSSEDIKLVETNVIYRSNTSDHVRHFNEIWWSEIKSGSRRDQLSVIFSMRRSGINFQLIPESMDIRDPSNPLYCLKPHQPAAVSATNSNDPPAFLGGASLPLNLKRYQKISVPQIVQNGLLQLTELGQVDSGVRLLKKLTQSNYRDKVRSYATFYLALHCVRVHKEMEARLLLEQLGRGVLIPWKLIPFIEFVVADIKIKADGDEALAMLSHPASSIDAKVQRLLAVCDYQDRLGVINELFEAQGLCRVRVLGEPLSLIDRLVPETNPPRHSRLHGKAKVSVIMPCYNVESTIETSMCSLLDQTWRNMEIIAVDDCSEDGTYAKLLALSNLDPRIKILRTEKNSGPYTARNLALSLADGDFITVCDADDWSHPQKIEIQARHLLSHPKLKGNTTCWLRADDQLAPERRPFQPFYIQINVSSLMLRRSVLVDQLCGWDEVRFSADSELYKRVQRKYSRRSIRNLDAIASISRIRRESLTHNSITGYPGYVYGARKEYLEVYSQYHASKSPDYFYDGRQRRAFAVPRIMRADRTSEFSLRFDLILAGDFRQRSHVRLAISSLLSALIYRRKIGFFQLSTEKLSPSAKISARLRTWLARLDNPLLTYGEHARAYRLVVIDRACLKHRQDFLPEIDAKDILILSKSAGQRINSEPGVLLASLRPFCSGNPRISVVPRKFYQGVSMALAALLGRLFWRQLRKNTSDTSS